MTRISLSCLGYAALELRFRQSIQIETISSPFWAPTLEFKLHLSNPENCSLGDGRHWFMSPRRQGTTSTRAG